MNGRKFLSLAYSNVSFFIISLNKRLEILISNFSGFWFNRFITLFCSLTFFIFWRTGPPRIAEDVSPSSVRCEMQTACTFSCHATSESPFNYSWTKNGHVPVSDDMKIINNFIVLTPRDIEDYGVYVCHATNSFGSTAYKITVSEGHKSSTLAGKSRWQ